MKNPNLPSTKDLKRGKIYLITNKLNSKYTSISYISHFYKKGVRVWILANMGVPVVTRLHRYSIKQLYMKTLLYRFLDKFTFKEIPITDLPIYIDEATPLMEKFLKKHI